MTLGVNVDCPLCGLMVVAVGSLELVIGEENRSFIRFHCASCGFKVEKRVAEEHLELLLDSDATVASEWIGESMTEGGAA